MSNEDLARMTGLSRSTICKLSKLDSWDTVTLATTVKFSRACGVNLLRHGDFRRLLQRRRAFFRNGSPAQRRMFDRILPKFVW